MTEEEKQERERKLKRGFIIAFIIVVLDVAALILGVKFNCFHITWAIGSVGIITFLGVLMLANSLSDSESVDKGEMRKAIAGSVIAVYFAVVTVLSFTKCSPANTKLAETIIGHFTYLVGIIVVFYFGSSGVREYLKSKEKLEEIKKKKPEEEQQPGNQGT